MSHAVYAAYWPTIRRHNIANTPLSSQPLMRYWPKNVWYYTVFIGIPQPVAAKANTSRLMAAGE